MPRATGASAISELAGSGRRRNAGRSPAPRRLTTLAYQVERYDDFQRRRLEVLPGVTGWAQIGGRNTLPWPERIKLDVWYVDHRSLLLDLRILAATSRVLFRPSSIYNDAQGDWGEHEERTKAD